MPYSSKPEERDSYKGKQFGIGTSEPEAFKPLFGVGAAASAACLEAAVVLPKTVQHFPPPCLPLLPTACRASSSLTGCRTASCSLRSRAR